MSILGTGHCTKGWIESDAVVSEIRFNEEDSVFGHIIAQATSRQLLIVEARVLSQVNLCGIFGGQCNTVAGFPLIDSVFLCQLH